MRPAFVLLNFTNNLMQAISAQIDATMQSARRPPSFRRGSKRYSIPGLATNVAAMLGGKAGHECRSTHSSLAQIDEQKGPRTTEIPRDIPTPARSDATPSSRMSYTGSIRSLKSEDADDIRAREEMDRINAEIMAEMEAERAGTPPKRADTMRSLTRAASMLTSNVSKRSSISLSSASIRSSKMEDPEDLRAMEEMARINAEILAAAAKEEQQEQGLSRQIYTPPQRPVNSHQRRPTWFDQAKLAIVHGSHGVLKFKTEGADLEIVKSPTEIETQRPQKAMGIGEPLAYDGPRHARLPTWADQATLSTVSGSHGMLNFKNGGADLEIVEAKNGVDESRRPRPLTRRLEPFDYNGPKHARLPTWADQATLPVVSGSHGVLKFGREGASMDVISSSKLYQPVSRHAHLPTWADQSKLDLVSGSWGRLAFREGGADMVIVTTPTADSGVAKHGHLPTWADQSFLPVIKGAHGTLNFHDSGANMQVIPASIIPEAAWFGKRDSVGARPQSTKNRSGNGFVSPYVTSQAHGSVKARELEIKQQRLSISNGLGSATMNHGRDITRAVPEDTQGKICIAKVGDEIYDLNHPALKEIVQAVTPPTAYSYWGADQRKLELVRGSHGSLEFTAAGATMRVVKKNPYWADQRTLSIVRGSHGRLVFDLGVEASMEVVRPDIYWVDQSTLEVVRGSHGRLVFGLHGESKMETVRPDPYWVDQSTLAVIQGSHGRLVFSPDGASLEIIRPDPYWADQSKLSLVQGSHGRLAFGPGGAFLAIVRPDPYWVDQSTLPVVKGSHGRLSFTTSGTSSVDIVRPDPYWVDQRSLNVVQGSYGRLTFGPDGASLKVVRSDPYWIDQSALSLVRGSHGRLAFTSNDTSALEIVRPDPYWTANQRTLPLVTGSHARLCFSPDGASLSLVRPDPYWSANQATLEIMMGAHATLNFDTSLAKMVIPLSNRTYWAANQAELEIVRGSHAALNFGASGARMTILLTNRTYWAADQAKLEILRGSHGLLQFTANGAQVNTARSRNSYWEADQASLNIVNGAHGILQFTTEGAAVHIVKQNPYWMVNQTSLEVIRGSHGHLRFNNEGAIVDSVKSTSVYWAANQATLRMIQGSHGMLSFDNKGASVKVKMMPTPYWAANQTKLEELRGSHGTLQFTSTGAAIHAQSNVDENSISQNSLVIKTTSAYWVDQASLQNIQGNHARLSFQNSISSSVPQIEPSNGWSSPPTLETGDFFPDSDSEEEARPMLAHSKRTSFGPGAFASILNRVKDRVPIVTNLVGNGSYSSFSHDEESPITPTDSNPSVLSLNNQPSIDEPIIHTSPESSHSRHQQARFEDNPMTAVYEEERGVKLSPLPTQMEFQFDPVYGQPIPVANRVSGLVHRAPISTKPFESVRGLASKNPFRTSVSGIPVRVDRNDGMIERRRALFENGSGGEGK
jgi:hypothetical protein